MTVGPEFETTIHWPLTRKDDRGHPVTTLQHLLRHHGHDIAADGIFGPRTDAAVRAFQKDEHLDVDGIAGPHTWSALIVTVRRGDEGDAVRGVQQEAVDRSGDPHHPALVIDGIFGPRTEAYVEGFQEALRDSFPEDGIAVDGIAGPVTWRAFVGGFLLG
jgi:peptidoglycan hydrolase-like protein with peptidoglycan-binding domain